MLFLFGAPAPVALAGAWFGMRWPFRDRRLKRFKSSRQCQRFVSIHGPIANLFHCPRNHLTAADYQELRKTSIQTWTQITMAKIA